MLINGYMVVICNWGRKLKYIFIYVILVGISIDIINFIFVYVLMKDIFICVIRWI